MPDTFDPDAWPGGNTGSTPPNNGKGGAGPNEFGSGAHSRDDDDFDAFGFNDEPAIPAGGNDDDDFGSFSYDFDDEPAPASQHQPSPIATSQRGGTDDFYGADDDDPYSMPYSADDDIGGGQKYDDDDDDFDRFDDFEDREPSRGGNLKRTLIGVGAVVFFLGALAFGLMTLLNGGDSKAKTKTPTPNPAPVQSAQPKPAPAPGANTGTSAPPANPNAPPIEVTKTLGDALRGWGQFAVNGDLDEVKNFFVPTSSQYLHFKDVESPALKAKPVGNPPYTMTMSKDDFKTVKSGNDWKISGTVTAKRPGENDQPFRWEFTMTQVSPNSPWQISQVRQF